MGKMLWRGILLCLLAAGPAWGTSPAELVSRGNRLYGEGNYGQALEAYEAASAAAPESARIDFNKGAAYYRQKDYEKAKKAFENAALKTKDPNLEAMARFNLGNCSFAACQGKKDSDPREMLAACRTSIRHYQDALALDPALGEAAENIEMVRLAMQKIIEEMQRQKEAAQKRREAAEKLEKLIAEQQELLDRNQRLAEEKALHGDSPARKEKTVELAADQKDAARKTRDLTEELQPAPSAPEEQDSDGVKQHLETAEKQQERAAEKLADMEAGAARPHQQKALEDLQAARAALAGNSDTPRQDEKEPPAAEKGNRNSGQQPPSGGSMADQQQPQSQKPQDAAALNPSDAVERQGQAALPADAKSILEEEKRNLRQRRTAASGGYREVERDW